MSESQYARKAMEEVIRLADEKMVAVQEYLIKRNEDFNQFARGCDDTAKDLNLYFNNLTKQLEKWKMTFMQDILENSKKREMDFSKQRSGLEEQARILRDLRERTGRSVALGGAAGGTDLVYQVHNCIFNINQEMENVDQFMGNCLPLKFVGKFQVDRMPKEEIGCLEQLVDIGGAEILPIKLPKIKLGQLFHLAFKLSDKHCEAARKFLTFGITKDDQKDQKVGAYLQDNKDGSYTLSFPITAIVPHTVHIKYMGQHIRNSPYTILFKIGSHTAVAGAPTMGDHKDSHAHLTAMSHLNDNNNAPKMGEIMDAGFGSSMLETKIESTADWSFPLVQSTSTPATSVSSDRGSNLRLDNPVPYESSEGPNSPLRPPSSFKEPYTEIKEEPITKCRLSGTALKKVVSLNECNSVLEDTLAVKNEKSIPISTIKKVISLDESINALSICDQENVPDVKKVASLEGANVSLPTLEEAVEESFLVKYLTPLKSGIPIKATKIGMIKGDLKFPIGVACSNDMKYYFICDTGNNLVKVFDASFSLVVALGASDNLHRPSSLLFLPNSTTNDLFVKDDFSVRLYRATDSMSIDWKAVQSSSRNTSRIRLYGLVLSPKGMLVTLDERNEVLCHINPTTVKTVQTFDYCPLKMLGDLRPKSKCRFFDGSPSGDMLFCSDLGLSVVYATTFEGIFLKQFGGVGREFGLLLEPSGISVINKEYLFIGDSKNNRIQIFTKDGKYKTFVDFNDRITRPSDIHLCPDHSTFLVVNYILHIIKVYKI